MKVLKYAAFGMLLTIGMSCSNDDDKVDQITGEGTLKIEFDNAYEGSDLLLGTSYPGNGTERLTIDTFKYIVSNISLTQEDGTVFTYPKDESLFVIDESDNDSRFISLPNVPAGNYTKISFGIGVDQEKYLQGAEGQGDFLAIATDAGMLWSWQAGYKFIRYEGSFSSDGSTEETAFAIHMGSHGSALDNYKEITLDLPVSAKLRTDIAPEIHIVADLAGVLNAETILYLTDKAQIHVDPVKSPQIAVNTSKIFTVDHVHN
ncbi:MbnP family protein [Croceivirga radicis]|uniref:MbnP family protein n=1 Tax=Croceivirga radicis TaxID=1929488 RepID=UPI000255B1BC|nr:MbnP family protein [Croceivirga radicis]